MAMNLSRTPEKKGVAEVIIFGLVFTFAIIGITSAIPVPGIGLILNFAGAYMIEMFFWNKYIGADTAYRKRPFWIPLLIGITLSAILIFLVMRELKH
jgi:hypothetical protein